ncbi:DotU family type VI secretion system protein [Piscinibacter sp. XHJ-5]|uniref:DotU family type VI secretion system protein n=1 Tax=Piscinibacter sp. XHJ-5 TaxID=3037797 RepID=UPI002452EDE8|nr:DotU family type VI secretion system protein [Piscinibacter sp. XHJ-5]
MEPSSINDPFAALDDQRTFIKPTPGGRTTTVPRPPDVATIGGDTAPPEPSGDNGLNPLVALANRLLLVVPQLRATRHVDDPAALRNSLAQGIRDFAARATAQGIAPERVMAARYVLCTMIDEAAADTPWGGAGVWGGHSLLAMFHNETEGGEKVFQLMARLAEKPAVNRDLLELIYSALTLGFEGRYRVIANGRAQLEAVRDKLAQILKQQRGDHAHALAQHWQGQPVGRRSAYSWLPLAAAAGVSALLMMGVYLALRSSLDTRSDPVFHQIQSLRLTAPVVSAPQPAPRPRLAQFLQSDIKAGLVAVRDEIDRSVVTIRGDGAFAPGSATLLPEREPLMGRIADALAQVSGNVLVTGHTDSQPISRTARFPSNWHLSEERARTVRDLLVSRKVAAERIRAEGRADAEPVVANDTAGNRALNRRVEVTLFVGRDAPNKAAAR